MTKGKRVRANPKDRKQSAQLTQEAIAQARLEIKPLQQNEANLFENIVEKSNNYAKLRKQYEQYSFILDQLQERRTKIQKGEIALPIQIQLSKSMFYSETDKKEVLKLIDDQIGLMQNSLTGIKGQLEHRREDYLETGLLLKKFANQRFGIFSKKRILTGDSVQPTKDEKKLFEAEIDQVLSDPETKKDFEKAMEFAQTENKKLEIKEK